MIEEVKKMYSRDLINDIWKYLRIFSDEKRLEKK